MTGRDNEDKIKQKLSLSKKRKNINVKGGTSAGSVTKTPITSFFSSQPPPKLACPLCGQLVPRFKINEHIDLQCQKFERRDSIIASGSSSVIPNTHMSPELDQNVQEVEKETKTSPYFKKNNFQHVPREINSKTVVRTIDLGSLASKLSRKYQKTPSSKPKDDKNVPKKIDPSETFSGSQKENVLIQELEDKNECVEANTAGMDTPTSLDVLLSEQGHNPELKASKTITTQTVFLPKLQSSPSKRKHETTVGSSGVYKKAKYKESGIKVEMSSEITQTECHKSDASSSNRPPFSSEESCAISVSGISGDSVPESSAESTEPSSLPYYLHNFRTVLHAVLENEGDKDLFNQEDMSHVHAFEKLSVKGQKLYVRLFQRKLKWLQINKLDYEEISKDLGPVAHELVQCGFLHTEKDLEDLGEALDLLPAPELKALAKTFHLGSAGTQKQHLVDGLLRLSKQKSFFSAQNNIAAVILKRAKQFAGSCVRLSQGPRAVFSRILLLFSLTDTMDEEEMAAGGQNQLFTILLVHSGRLAFPDYTVQRVAKVFRDREDLIRYEASMRALIEVTSAMQTGQWELALDLYNASKSTWQELRKNHDLRHQEELPVFLRSFTTGWAYTRILSRGVEILQRLRRYEEAAEELQSLLQQSVYCPDSRGRWWDRLALNLHQHLKKPEKAICAIRDGMSDPHVRTGHKLSLHQRAVRMKESASCKKHRLQLRELPTVQVQDVHHVTIRGQLFPHEGGTGKSRFLLQKHEDGEESAHETVICSVEELSLAHYRQQGFDQGIHGEGSTFSTLFGLLMWDIIFMEGIPDVFRNPYQMCPLDLYTDCFYENRKEAIASRIQLLRQASTQSLRDMLENVWNCQESKVCSLVSWERFSSLQQAQSLVACLGGPFLAGILDRMAKDYRHCRGGLPDLVVWNTSNNTYKLVEVKGPNDRLSQKQQIWLDELQKLGADVEVCHVTAIGARGARLEKE